MQRVPGYTAHELDDLRNEASSQLGKRIVFRDVRIEGDPTGHLTERLLKTRQNVAIAVTSVDFYPHQSTKWQEWLEEDRDSDGNPKRRRREPGQIFSRMGQAGNPLVGVTLPRGPHATTDPLAMFPRVLAVFPNGHAEEHLTWKNLLTHRRLGNMRLDPAQMKDFRDAVNWAQSSDPHAHVRLVDVNADLPAEERAPLSGAHSDQQGKFQLLPEAIETLKAVLQKILGREMEG